MPSDLDIDYKRALKGSVAPYSDHLLLHTGHRDWPSRIEDDDRYPLARDIKTLLKAEIVKSAPATSANVLATNSSFPAALKGSGCDVVSLLKAGLHLKIAGKERHNALDSLVKATMSQSMSKGKLRESFRTMSIEEVFVLICGHAGRDKRCGVMGPLLQTEFETRLPSKGFEVLDDPISLDADAIEAPADTENKPSVRVGLISHIGGHAFAGNVIIYVPATARYKAHPLAGLGVWYGRVEPRHVEGIIQRTIREGVVIEELLRGVV